MSEINEQMMSSTRNFPSADTLLSIFGSRLQRDVRMSHFSSAKVGGPVDFLAICENAAELEQDIATLWRMDIPFTLLGGASNVLVSEKGMRGLVLINHARRIQVDDQSPTPVIHAESGALMSLITNRAGKAGLTGLEWANGLPGTLGGAIYGNAGAFGSEISENLIVANILHWSQGSTRWSVGDFEYQYRSSNLKRQHCSQKVVILSADLKVEHSDPATILEKMTTLKNRRETKQPPGACTGSMFKNPAGHFAGKLIEEAGLKGTKIGDVEISQKHGNFFINNGNGTADDFMKLINLTRESIASKFGVEMELEVELLGDWDG